MTHSFLSAEDVFEQYKKCTRCGEMWPADPEFFRPRRKDRPYKPVCWCRACEAEQKAESRKRGGPK